MPGGSYTYITQTMVLGGGNLNPAEPRLEMPFPPNIGFIVFVVCAVAGLTSKPKTMNGPLAGA